MMLSRKNYRFTTRSLPLVLLISLPSLRITHGDAKALNLFTDHVNTYINKVDQLIRQVPQSSKMTQLSLQFTSVSLRLLSHVSLLLSEPGKNQQLCYEAISSTLNQFTAWLEQERVVDSKASDTLPPCMIQEIIFQNNELHSQALYILVPQNINVVKLVFTGVALGVVALFGVACIWHMSKPPYSSKQFIGEEGGVEKPVLARSSRDELLLRQRERGRARDDQLEGLNIQASQPDELLVTRPSSLEKPSTQSDND